MTRARLAAGIPRRRPPSPATTVALAATALFLAACGSTSLASPSPTGAGLLSPSASRAPLDEPSVPASVEVSASASPAATLDASDEPTEPPGASGPDTAARCSGNAANRSFYAAVADAVAWEVYCPVLETGWFLDSGTWHAKDSGRMDIIYRSRSGARFELHEGAFCTDADGCAPNGSDAGSAAFGDRDGTLVEASDGSWAIVVDRGQKVSWLAVGRALDQPTFERQAAALVRVNP